MDCEKFEPLLLDELYEELDELTSAAVKRHVSGCARCGGILNGLRSTRRAVTLPLLPVPDGLEERILAAAKEAQKVVPIRSRFSRVVSVAGSWAMRPQTAMAAVFLLMIGTSAFLIRSKNYASKDGAVAVTVQGDPAPVAPTPADESLDDRAAASAHGPGTPNNVTHPPAAVAPAVAANEDGTREKAKHEDTAGALADSKDSNLRPAPTGGYAPPTNAAAPAGAPFGDPAQAQAQSAPMARSGPSDKQAQDPFALGNAAFRARNYAEAVKWFDQAAQNGNDNAALWAADSVREGQGCVIALGRFEQLAQKASGWVGHEASLRAARCQMAMGQPDPARDRLNRVASAGSPEQKQAAQQALGELNQTAGRKAGGAAGGAVAAPKRAAPASRPASPARAPAEAAEQKKSLDRSDGY